MSRLIVEVVRIKEMQKHPNADTLSITPIKGWQCIVKSDMFQVGDLAIYVPIDSVLPEKIIQEHNISYLKKGERVMAAKLRGIVSQGLLLKVPQGTYREGQNVADLLGITKWEPPAPEAPNFNQLVKGRSGKYVVHPDLLKYTDIENMRNYPGLIPEGEEVVITEKIHGTNFRVGRVRMIPNTWRKRLLKWFRGKTHEPACGSHNTERPFSDPLYGRVGRAFAGSIEKDCIAFGEIYGKGVQDLTYGQEDEVEVKFFDIMRQGKYLDFDEFIAYCESHGLGSVPVLYRGPWRKDLISLAYGPSTLYAGHIREGIVVKPAKERFDPHFGRVILKYVSDDYLTRKNGTEFH